MLPPYQTALAEVERLRSEKGLDLSRAARDVWKERERQKSSEGFNDEHDDRHTHGELASAAACYALAARGLGLNSWLRDIIDRLWPWEREWWKYTDRRRCLVKSGALILAEIERIDRTALKASRSDTAAPASGRDTP